jgi:hypothetical protein
MSSAEIYHEKLVKVLRAGGILDARSSIPDDFRRHLYPESSAAAGLKCGQFDRRGNLMAPEFSFLTGSTRLR